MDGGTSIMAELTRGQILKNPEVLGVGNTGAKIRLLDADENSHIDIKVPDTVGTAYTFTLPSDDGTPGQVLQTDGSGTTSWTSVTASPAGSDTYIQFNDGGNLGGDVDLTWNKTTNLLDVNGNIQLKATGEIRFADSDSSNYVAFKSPATVSTNNVYTLPNTVGTAGQALVIASAGGGAATLEWNAPSGGTTQDPGGDTDGSVQYNVGGTFTGETAFKYNQSTNTLSVDNITATSITSDNINLDGNAIISTNTNGNIDLNPNGTGFVRILDDAPLRFMDGDNSNYAAITAPASITSDYTITLPAAGGAANDVLQFDGSQNASFVSNTRTLNFVIDGGGSAITTGIKGHIVLDGDYTVTGWTIIADQSGSIVVDVNRATYTNFPTTASIAGSELPTLSSAQKNEDLTLSTWTTTLSARDILEFQVDSATTVTRVTVALRLVPR
jgi:hypothetical protein